MKVRLKRLPEQVVVITGASSGIGRVTARMAAAEGARVVLAARSGEQLEQLATEIRAAGGQATAVVADVSDPQQVQAIAETALREHGRIDTWVNNAGATVYGRMLEIPLEDMRRVMDVVYWSQVHGARTAVPLLARQGGALVNVGSIASERAMPLQGPYSAAKQAIKGFTDTLRMEIEEQGLPVSVSLVKPASIDTPFFEHAKSHMGVEPRPVPPVYAPELVARTILRCAQVPVRDIIVGGSGKVIHLSDVVSPRLTDRFLEHSGFTGQQSDHPVTRDRRDNLFSPVPGKNAERSSNWDGRVVQRSLYTTAALHPRGAMLAAAALGIAAVGLLFGRREG